MSEKLRLRDVDAKRLSKGLLGSVRYMRSVIAGLSSARLETALKALVAYARGAGDDADVEGHLSVVSGLYASANNLNAPPVLEPEPSSPLALVVAAVIARLALDRGRPLSASELAVLSGVNRDHIIDLARKGHVPSAYRDTKDSHRPWRFRATEALKKWIEERNA